MTAADDLRAAANELDQMVADATASLNQATSQIADIEQSLGILKQALGTTRIEVNGAAAVADDIRVIADSLSVPPPDPDPDPDPQPSGALHGAYVGIPWPGPLQIRDLHVAQGSWSAQRSTIAGWGDSTPVKANIGLWPKQAYPAGSATLARAANGEFDAEHRSNATAIKAEMTKKVYIALGHEANDNATQPWGFTRSTQDGVNYRAAFNRIAAQYKQVLGSQAVITFMPGLWNITLTNLRAWTPSASEVVGIDVYDRGSNITNDPAARWNQRHKPGMDALAAYAAEKGQRTIIGEWGLSTPMPPGGGDNPYFVNKIADWMVATKCVADLYHQSDSSSGAAANHDIKDYPKAWAAYQQRFM